MCIRGIAAGLLLLCATFSARAEEPHSWHPAETGCFEQPLRESLEAWEDAPLGMSSLRYAVVPDARGPMFVVQIDQGLRHRPPQPYLVIAAGDLTKTCVARIAAEDCPDAALARAQLLETQIPVGQDVDALTLRLHPTTYALEVHQGFSGRNRWRAWDADHPLARAIEDAHALLQSCWQPVADALAGVSQ